MADVITMMIKGELDTTDIVKTLDSLQNKGVSLGINSESLRNFNKTVDDFRKVGTAFTMETTKGYLVLSDKINKDILNAQGHIRVLQASYKEYKDQLKDKKNVTGSRIVTVLSHSDNR